MLLKAKNKMNILCIGDVVGTSGCNALRKHLPNLKKLYNIDVSIVNGENSADGNGILPISAENIFSSGADVVTTGNHVFRRREIYNTLDSNEFLIRPYNFPSSAPGKGITYIDKGRSIVAVINMLGVVYMENMTDPFLSLQMAVEEAKENGANIIVVDFHAEATAEKRAVAFFMDGKVSAFFGTHTHVQTADETILPNGTGYITDVGMTGPAISVLGVKPELAIAKQKDKLPVRFENAEGDCIIGGCIFEVDDKTGICTQVKRILIV